MSGNAPRDVRLPQTRYARFPFRIEDGRVQTGGRLEHIRDVVETILLTSPGERVFRPEWGFGARAFLFEPNASAIWEVARSRLQGALADALEGEIDPRTLKVAVGAPADDGATLLVEVSYVIAALQRAETHQVRI